jgi:hypothetical protein
MEPNMSQQQEQIQERHITPYETFLREAIEKTKKERDELYNQFAHANPVMRAVIKRSIERATQNIEITTKELQKYSSGTSWLREPSKERDEKAEELKKVPVDEVKAPAPTPVAKPIAPATPAGTAKPAPVPQLAAAPKPVATQPAQAVASPSPPAPAPNVSKPVSTETKQDSKPPEPQKPTEQKKSTDSKEQSA